ncbi:MAG: hypothetical protein QOJ73_6473 [Streptosporangiaceae bacterium]|nr:hypothetical protein [Streptosporangiaceae bacterium]
MAWADPELDVGVAEALTLLELGVLFAELLDVPPADAEVLVPEAVAAVEPGKVSATAPAVTIPAAPTEMVTARSLAMPR